MADHCFATGYAARHLPPGDETDDVLRIIRLGLKFDRRGGKSPGYLHKYLAGIVAEIPQPTFQKLLTALELEAVRRDQDGDSPIERVSRAFEFVRYHDPRHGEKEITFRSLRDYLTALKKENSGLPINGESRLKECVMLCSCPAKIKEKTPWQI